MIHNVHWHAHRCTLGLLVLSAVLVADSTAVQAEQARETVRSSPTEAFQWNHVNRVVAIGDLHGHHHEMVALLEGADLVDADGNWDGGDTHLVLLGDLMDRGPNDRAVLDLARRIQPQAADAGGRVHVLLGNHEVMNLVGNYRYVAAESFAEFAEEETQDERNRGLRSFRQSLASRGISNSEVQAAFDERFPVGYFAWRRAFAATGEYGSWLFQQPTAIQINGRVFVHGGLTQEVAALGLTEINLRMQADIQSFLENARQLEKEAEWPHSYRDITRAALKISKDSGRRGRNSSGPSGAAWRIVQATETLPFATDGPVWYRGNAIENERIEERRLERVLRLLGASGLVVAHTPTKSAEITSRFNGRLHRTDVGMGYGRDGRALLINEGQLVTIDADTNAIGTVRTEPPVGEGWPQGEEELPDDVMERFLTRAKVKSTDETDFGIPVKLLELEDDGIHLRAIFGYAQESAKQAADDGRTVPRRYQNTIAAYRLDRLMNLGRVPVTVPRRVKGKRGLVQVWLQSAWDQELIEEYEAWDYLEGLEEEMAEAAAFSALIGIADRIPAGRMFIPETERIVLADNSVSFPKDVALEPYLPDGCGPVSASFTTALGSLQRTELIELFDKLVSTQAIDALLARRDRLVQSCEKPNPDWSIDKIRQRIAGSNNRGIQ